MDPIQMLWIGPRLSALERLSMASFLAHGHEVRLYTYGDVEGIPPGVTHHDGREIVPASQVFTYASGFGKGSYAAAFCPIDWWNAQKLVSEPWRERPESHAIHFWNEVWRYQGLEKDGTYPPGSTFETLKRRYGVSG